MKLFYRYNLHILTLYFLLAFPMFYFVYKFGVLLEGYDDAKSYLKLMADLTSKEVPSPFNLRLLSSSIVHLMQKSGLVYNTQCAIDAFSNVDKSFFFHNILFNFSCIFLTAFSVYITLIRLKINALLSFLSGAVFLLGFGTIFYLMMPGVDALSVLISVWIVYSYYRKSYWIIPLFFLMIFQREYYFLVFGLVALVDYFKYKKEKYYLHVIMVAVISFGIYYVLRKTIFYTDHWNHQTSPEFLLGALFDIKIPIVPMIRQTLMTMNIYFIYLFILMYKISQGHKINKYNFYITLVLFAEITILSIAATFGNNNGRYFYLNTPMILYYAALELSPILLVSKSSSSTQETE